jgi:hypothetical protein
MKYNTWYRCLIQLLARQVPGLTLMEFTKSREAIRLILKTKVPTTQFLLMLKKIECKDIHWDHQTKKTVNDNKNQLKLLISEKKIFWHHAMAVWWNLKYADLALPRLFAGKKSDQFIHNLLYRQGSQPFFYFWLKLHFHLK